MMKRITIALLTLVAIIIGAVFSGKTVSAFTFDRSYIISDYVFYNSTSMNAADIQYFLNGKLPVCESYTTYANIGTPIPCLKDYRVDVPTMEPDTYCGGITGGNLSAAETISKISTACGINPQILLVTLQKEQSLVTDTWPRDGGSCLPYFNNCGYSYRSAMGYACPDSAACNPDYYGFFKQVYYMARQWKMYRLNPNSFNYVAGLPATIDGATFTIQNQATAGLYNYTPHFHGNENFFAFFTNWFGDTKKSPFTPMSDPRLMVVNQNTLKIWPDKNTLDDLWLESGWLLKFTSKTTISWGGEYKTCLRTEADTINDNKRCVLMDRLDEYNVSYERIDDTYMYANSNTLKIYPEKHSFDTYWINKFMVIKFTSKATIDWNGEQLVCLRTESDTLQNISRCVLQERLSALPALDHYVEFDAPIVMKANTNTLKIFPDTKTLDPSYWILPGHIITFTHMTATTWGDGYIICLRTESDTNNNVNRCVLAARVS
jgi:hypothetical protein